MVKHDSPEKPVILQRTALRFLCTFLPWLVPPRRGVTTPEHWDRHGTAAFNEIEPESMAMLEEIMALAPDRGTRIVDLGCNVGRHLNHLYGKGYRNLRGVDFSRKAVEDMAARYPDMHRASGISVASFQDYFAGKPEHAEISYSRGATFELVHPSYPIVKRVCEHTRKHVVLVIREAGHLFPRFWRYEFARAGFELAHLRLPASSLAPERRASLLTFTRVRQ